MYIGFKLGLAVIKDELHIYHNKNIITKHKITNLPINKKTEHKLTYEKNDSTEIKESTIIKDELRSINYD